MERYQKWVIPALLFLGGVFLKSAVDRIKAANNQIESFQKSLVGKVVTVDFPGFNWPLVVACVLIGVALGLLVSKLEKFRF